jgi:ribosomal protein S18 acetylase RimI-like enzyme
MQKLNIRPIVENEISLLETFLYESIFIPEGIDPPPFEIIKTPEIFVYIEDFGKQKDDFCLVAEINGKIVGAVWIRILAGEVKGFGNIDSETPEFAISVLKEYRNQGIGAELMRQMIGYLKSKDYKQTSLAVQKTNYAVRMYQKVGFEIVKDIEPEYIMVLKLCALCG